MTSGSELKSSNGFTGLFLSRCSAFSGFCRESTPLLPFIWSIKSLAFWRPNGVVISTAPTSTASSMARVAISGVLPLKSRSRYKKRHLARQSGSFSSVIPYGRLWAPTWVPPPAWSMAVEVSVIYFLCTLTRGIVILLRCDTRQSRGRGFRRTASCLTSFLACYVLVT